MIAEVYTQQSPDDIACLPEEVISYVKALESVMRSDNILGLVV